MNLASGAGDKRGGVDHYVMQVLSALGSGDQDDSGTTVRMTDVHIDAYFERIGFAGSIAPTLETLAQFNALHPAAIPF